MVKIGNFIIGIVVLFLVAGGVTLAYWDIPAPQKQVEYKLPVPEPEARY